MKNNYVFTYDNGELTNIEEKSKKYRNLYNEILNKYRESEKEINNYKDEMLLMRKFRNETLDLLKKIVNEYEYFNNNAIVYLTGSYARNTMRLFSDVDINIVYIRGTGKKYQKYEELFYYMICKTLDKPRKSVHSIITAFNDEKNIKQIQKYMDNSNIDIVLKEKNKIINYTIPYISKKRFYLQYLNNKNYKVIFNNIINQYNSIGIYEWSNNFLFLNNNNLVQKYYDNYITYLFENIDTIKIKNLYEKIIEAINKPILKFDCIKNIKNTIQMNELHIIYNSVLLLQIINYKKNGSRIYNSYNDIIDKTTDKIKKIINMFHEYNYYIIKLNLLFEQNKIEYSIHTEEKINLNKHLDIKLLLNETINYREKINKNILELLNNEVKNYD